MAIIACSGVTAMSGTLSLASRLTVVAALLCGGIMLAQTQAGTESRGSRNQQTGPAPYMESPTAYPERAPSGCVGCVATPAEARTLSQRQFAQAGQGPAPAGQSGAPAANAQVAPRRVGPRPNLPNPLPYDLILKGGHVIDVKNNIDKVIDVAIKDGKVASVAANINAADAAK